MDSIASRGLINSNANWEKKSDDCFLLLGLEHVQRVLRLFAKYGNRDVVLLATKIVDDILLIGEDATLRHFGSNFNSKFRLGEVVHVPSAIRLYGLNVIQCNDYFFGVHGDDNSISQTRRAKLNKTMKDIQKKAFMSVTSSIGWLGIIHSTLCSFYASNLQLIIIGRRVSALISQYNALRILKKY